MTFGPFGLGCGGQALALGHPKVDGCIGTPGPPGSARAARVAALSYAWPCRPWPASGRYRRRGRRQARATRAWRCIGRSIRRCPVGGAGSRSPPPARPGTEQPRVGCNCSGQRRHRTPSGRVASAGRTGRRRPEPRPRGRRGSGRESRDRLLPMAPHTGQRYAGDLDCSADGDLLAKDGAHADLQSRPRRRVRAGLAGRRPAAPDAHPSTDVRRFVSGSAARSNNRRTRAMICWQSVQLRKAHRHGERSPSAGLGDEGALAPADRDGAGVRAVHHHFDTANGPRCEEGQDGVPIIRRFVGQLQGDGARRRGRLSTGAAKGDRRAI